MTPNFIAAPLDIGIPRSLTRLQRGLQSPKGSCSHRYNPCQCAYPLRADCSQCQMLRMLSMTPQARDANLNRKSRPPLEVPGGRLWTASPPSIHFVRRAGKQRRKHGQCAWWHRRSHRPRAGREHFAEENLVAKASTLPAN